MLLTLMQKGGLIFIVPILWLEQLRSGKVLSLARLWLDSSILSLRNLDLNLRYQSSFPPVTTGCWLLPRGLNGLWTTCSGGFSYRLVISQTFPLACTPNAGAQEKRVSVSTEAQATVRAEYAPCRTSHSPQLQTVPFSPPGDCPPVQVPFGFAARETTTRSPHGTYRIGEMGQGTWKMLVQSPVAQGCSHSQQ